MPDNATNLPNGTTVQVFSDHVEYRFTTDPMTYVWALLAFLFGVGSLATASFDLIGPLSYHKGKLFGISVICILVSIIVLFVRTTLEVWADRVVAKFLLGPWAFPRKRYLKSADQLIVRQPLDEKGKPTGKNVYSVYLDDLCLVEPLSPELCKIMHDDIVKNWSRLQRK